jgi:hypothetical protein
MKETFMRKALGPGHRTAMALNTGKPKLEIIITVSLSSVLAWTLVAAISGACVSVGLGTQFFVLNLFWLVLSLLFQCEYAEISTRPGAVFTGIVGHVGLFGLKLFPKSTTAKPSGTRYNGNGPCFFAICCSVYIATLVNTVAAPHHTSNV